MSRHLALRARGHVLRVAVGLALGFWASGCRSDPPPASVPPSLTHEKIERDLVGQRFTFFEDADGPREWTIEASEIRSVTIVDTVRASPERLRARTHVLLAASSRTIQGDLHLDYRWAASGWRLDELSRAGPNFTAGDASFVLYEVSTIPEDTLGNGRGLALDVIARFDAGGFEVPFKRFRREIAALADSVFASDSLRQLAEDALGDRMATAFARPGATVRVIGAGKPARTVRLREAEVSVYGCEYLRGVTGRDALSVGGGALGTTSSVVGGAQGPGRRMAAAETRQLDALVRERLRVRGIPDRRLRAGGSLAVDLDGDGADDWIGAYNVGSTEGGRGLVVGARPTSGAPRLLFELATAPGHQTFTLLGALDLDADGAVEPVLLEEGDESYQYLILTHRAGRFTTAFRGGGGGC